jgi:hypothetical protein
MPKIAGLPLDTPLKKKDFPESVSYKNLYTARDYGIITNDIRGVYIINSEKLKYPDAPPEYSFPINFKPKRELNFI